MAPEPAYPSFPLVHKEPLSLIALGAAGEAQALRGVLECFGYRVEAHWVGSRAEFLAILCGAIPTQQKLILSCHGAAGAFPLGSEQPVAASDLAGLVQLPAKLVLSTGCETGTGALAAAFLGGGCTAYIAPTGAVESNAAILFALHLFYRLARERTLAEAVTEARAQDGECALFSAFV
jgi:hypothetical protein